MDTQASWEENAAKASEDRKLIYSGTCWKFGDNISCDADLMKKEFSTSRETRLEILAPYVMCGVDPTFAERAQPGDLIVAGRRFGQGNPHIQGFLGIAGLKLGLVVESIPRGAFRNAVNAGVPLLPHCEGVTQLCESGDELIVDFDSGKFENVTRNIAKYFDPLDERLRYTVRIGGWEAMVRERLAGNDLGRIPED